MFSVNPGAGEFLLSAVVLLLILLAGCGQKKDAEGPNSVFRLSTQPEIRFPADFYDPTEIKANAYKIDILNDGDRPVEFEDVRKSCACTLMDVPAGLLGPGEKASVAIEVAGGRGIGSKVFSLLFTFKGREPVRCMVFTEAYPEYNVQGGDRKYLGKIHDNTPGTLEFNLMTYAAKEGDLLRVESVSGANDKVTIELTREPDNEESESNVFAGNTNVKVSVTPTLVHGEHNETIDFVLRSANGKTQKVPVHLAWHEHGVLTATPARIFVNRENEPSIATSALIERMITIRSVDSRPFSIESVNCPSEAIKADFGSKKHSEQRLTIWIDRSRIERLLWTSIEVKVSNGLGVIRVPVGVYLPKGQNQ